MEGELLQASLCDTNARGKMAAHHAELHALHMLHVLHVMHSPSRPRKIGD